ncbi:c-type cytochrome [Spiribacter halobius]|nr:cytochrome c [Spiribacter halobius]UEX76519.1 cytochrome c [Spiribacter halobius]
MPWMPRALLACALVLSTPALAGDIAAGREAARQCMACHGLDGLARQPDAGNLAGQTEIYLREQLKAYRSGKRRHPQMNVIAQGLSDEQIEDLAAWYSAIEIEVRMPE